MNPSPEVVHDHESAVSFIQWCVEEIGLGYHPDTPFADYVCLDGSGQATFSQAEAARLQELSHRAFQFCDPYEIGHDELQRILHEGDSQTV